MKRPELLTREKKQKVSVFSVLFLIIIILIFAFLIFELWFMGRFTPVCVDGDSMLSTLNDGDWLYAEKKEARRGDIVILDVREYQSEYGYPLFQNGGKPISFIIKRVVAVGGDTVSCVRGVVYLKRQGEAEATPLNESYAQGRTPDFFPVTLGQGEIFVLGDNRTISLDCTETGPLYARSVTGVVPAWAVEWKGTITWWENLRERVRNIL